MANILNKTILLIIAKLLKIEVLQIQNLSFLKQFKKKILNKNYKLKIYYND